MSDETTDDTSTVPDKRVRLCRGCRARIIYLPTAAGRTMPVNAETVDAEDEVYEHGKHVSHFATCPDHERFRRGGSHE